MKAIKLIIILGWLIFLPLAAKADSVWIGNHAACTDIGCISQNNCVLAAVNRDQKGVLDQKYGAGNVICCDCSISESGCCSYHDYLLAPHAEASNRLACYLKQTSPNLGEVDAYYVNRQPSSDGTRCEPQIGSNAPSAPTPSADGQALYAFEPISNPLKTTDFNVVAGRVIKAFFAIIGTIALLMAIYGGFMWMTAAGNQAKAKKGMSTLVWMAAGLLIIYSAYVLVKFVLEMVGK